MINWPVELLELVSLQQETERESRGLNQASFFASKASNEQILTAEKSLNISFDEEHKKFLTYTDGWVGFSANIDLFSTQDYLGSNKFSMALERIRLMDDGVLGKYSSSRNDLFPIGMSTASSDLFLMVKGKTGRLQSKVIWFANELIEEFDSFEQMFVSFKEYERKAIQYWRDKYK